MGLHTHDPDIAARWSREAPYNAKKTGVVSDPYVVHFEPAHHGWPDVAAVRALRRLGADCTLRPDGVIVVKQPRDVVRRAFAQLKLDIFSDDGTQVQLHAPQGEAHGLEVIRSIHRLHADIVRNPDGSIQLRNLYHYPDKAPTHAPKHFGEFAKHNQFITKRQWVKIPEAISKRHWIVSQPETKK